MSTRILVAVVVTFHTIILPTFLMVFVVQTYESRARQPAVVNREHLVTDQTPLPLLDSPEPFHDPSPEPALCDDPPQRENQSQSELVAVAHVRRSVVEQALENLYDLNHGLRILPYERNRRVVGVKLYGVRSRSIVGVAGFRNGDVITTLNGEPVMGTSTITRLFPRLPTILEIGIIRRGRPGRLVVLIEDDPPLDRVTRASLD